MANLLLTNVCNRRCPYCFAQGAMGAAETPRVLSLPDAVRAADVLVASRVGRVGLLGGEPTLHPHFVDLCRYFLERRLRVTVFTNGLTSPATVAALAAIPAALPLTCVVNVNYPELAPPGEIARQREFLTALGARCEISLNLWRADLDPCFAAELGEECRTSRSIRLGLAQPGTDGGSRFLAAADYRAAAAQVTRLVAAAFARGGSVHFDCGFTLCSFTDEQLGFLRRCGTRLRFVCDLALDIGPTLDVWGCFPLVDGPHVPLTEASRVDELHHRLQETLEATRRERRAFGVFPECEACAYRRARTCAGGCLAHALRVAPDGVSAPVGPL